MTSIFFANSAAPWLLLLGLSFFFGLAFEEFFALSGQKRPGGIRTFPLLALTGALLHQLAPSQPLLLGIGLLALSVWLALYYRHGIAEIDADGFPNVGMMVPVCNVLAFLLGPLALTSPPWMPIGVTVAGILFLDARKYLHELALKIDQHEIVNAGRFLLITGLVLPLLPDRPVTTLTTITPHLVWLAMVAVSGVSYVSYLLRRYLVPTGSGLLVALLGGFYSSTVTTIVLAQRARTEPDTRQEAQSGIVLANAVMYLRLLAIIFFFDRQMALTLAPWMIALSVLGMVLAGGWYWLKGRSSLALSSVAPVANPLGLGTAATFAILFVAVSILTSWVMRKFGTGGIYSLSAIIGVTDINPFVLSLAQHGAAGVPDTQRATAVLVATSSNNIFQSIYAIFYSRGQVGVAPIAGLILLAAAGIAGAFLLS